MTGPVVIPEDADYKHCMRHQEHFGIEWPSPRKTGIDYTPTKGSVVMFRVLEQGVVHMLPTHHGLECHGSLLDPSVPALGDLDTPVPLDAMAYYRMRTDKTMVCPTSLAFYAGKDESLLRCIKPWDVHIPAQLLGMAPPHTKKSVQRLVTPAAAEALDPSLFHVPVLVRCEIQTRPRTPVPLSEWIPDTLTFSEFVVIVSTPIEYSESVVSDAQ